MEELLLDPKDPIFDEVDPYFFEKDRQDAIRIKKLRDSYYVDGALQDYYNIYGAGAPFERLFFEARRQLQHAIERLGYERAERTRRRWTRTRGLTTSLRHSHRRNTSFVAPTRSSCVLKRECTGLKGSLKRSG